MYPGLHEQMGLWCLTTQRVFCPHVPGHGLMHFWFKHDLSIGHSVLMTHSGRQLGGLLTYEGKQEQIAWPFCSRHWLFGPHGDGWQGCNGAIGASAKINYFKNI